MRDVYQARLFLETTAAERSCARRPDSALPAAKTLLEQTVRYLKRSPRRYIQANFAFHRTIYRYCDSEIFLRLIDLLWTRIGPYFYYAQLRKDVDLSASQRHHKAMYEAWASRDTTRMVAAIRNDLASPIPSAPPSITGRRKTSPASRGASRVAGTGRAAPPRSGRQR